jgi:cytidine deaminase
VKPIPEEKLKQLERAAAEARKKSYAPYSHFAVGAALLGENGMVYTGCNIENASYPAGICAERTAIFKAVSEGCRRFRAIAIAGGPEGADCLTLCTPCGICRQVMREFTGPDFPVWFSDGNGGFRMMTLAQLLPESFGPDSL